MINILLEGFHIGEPWPRKKLKKYLKPAHSVAIVTFSFRDSHVKSLPDWDKLYSKENGKYYSGIVGSLTAYGIPEEKTHLLIILPTQKNRQKRKLNRLILFIFSAVCRTKCWIAWRNSIYMALL